MTNFNFKFCLFLILTLICINSCDVEELDIQYEELATVPILEVQPLLQITETDEVLFSSISGLVKVGTKYRQRPEGGVVKPLHAANTVRLLW